MIIYLNMASLGEIAPAHREEDQILDGEVHYI